LANAFLSTWLVQDLMAERRVTRRQSGGQGRAVETGDEPKAFDV